MRCAFGYRDNVMQNGFRIFGEREAKKIPLRRKRLALLPSLTLVKSSTCKPLAVWRLLANLRRDDTVIFFFGFCNTSSVCFAATVNFAAGKFAAACRLFPLKGKASKRLAFVYKVFVYQISVAFPCGYPNYREDHFGWWYQNGSGSYCSYRKSRKPARVVTN